MAAPNHSVKCHLPVIYCTTSPRMIKCRMLHGFSLQLYLAAPMPINAECPSWHPFLWSVICQLESNPVCHAGWGYHPISGLSKMICCCSFTLCWAQGSLEKNYLEFGMLRLRIVSRAGVLAGSNIQLWRWWELLYVSRTKWRHTVRRQHLGVIRPRRHFIAIALETHFEKFSYSWGNELRFEVVAEGNKTVLI